MLECMCIGLYSACIVSVLFRISTDLFGRVFLVLIQFAEHKIGQVSTYRIGEEEGRAATGGQEQREIQRSQSQLSDHKTDYEKQIVECVTMGDRIARSLGRYIGKERRGCRAAARRDCGAQGAGRESPTGSTVKLQIRGRNVKATYVMLADNGNDMDKLKEPVPALRERQQAR